MKAGLKRVLRAGASAYLGWLVGLAVGFLMGCTFSGFMLA